LEQEAWLDGQADHLGSCEVEDQLELYGAFHGQGDGLGALEDLVHGCCEGAMTNLQVFYSSFTTLL